MRRQRLTVRRRSRRRRVWVAATIMGGMRCVIGVITWPRRRQRLRRRPAAWLPRPAERLPRLLVVGLRLPLRPRLRLVPNHEETLSLAKGVRAWQGRPFAFWSTICLTMRQSRLNCPWRRRLSRSALHKPLGIISGERFSAARSNDDKRTRFDPCYTGRGRSRPASTIQKNPNLPFVMALN